MGIGTLNVPQASNMVIWRIHMSLLFIIITLPPPLAPSPPPTLMRLTNELKLLLLGSRVLASV